MAALLLGGAVAGAGCGSGAGAGPLLFDDVDGSAYTSPWIGVFEGPGSGTLAGTSVTWDQVRLVIRIDADSVRLERCPDCLTLDFDSLFSAVNVMPVSEVRLEAEDSAAAAPRSLTLDRYSGQGGIGNVVVVSLTIGGPGGGSADYVLQRR